MSAMTFPATTPIGELLAVHPTRRLNAVALACLPAVIGGLCVGIGVLGLAGIYPWGEPEGGGGNTAGALRMMGFGAVMIALSVWWARRRLRRFGEG